MNERVIHNEVKKMSAEEKRALAETLLAEVGEAETAEAVMKRPVMAGVG